MFIVKSSWAVHGKVAMEQRLLWVGTAAIMWYFSSRARGKLILSINLTVWALGSFVTSLLFHGCFLREPLCHFLYRPPSACALLLLVGGALVFGVARRMFRFAV